MKTSQRILICPLEWGLGHAGRMIPLARKLQKMNNEIFIGAGQEHLALFRQELPGSVLIEFKGFKPGYSGVFPQYLILLFKIPVLFFHIITEHFRLKGIIREHKIDIVISDNRLGLWRNGMKTVYISHLLRIPFPRKLRWLEPVGIIIHRFFIRRYSYCYIPDVPGRLNISGRLSHGLKLHPDTRFIGILSRFSGPVESVRREAGLPVKLVLLILSGPEPQRRILKQKVTDIFKDSDMQLTILEGKPGGNQDAIISGNICSYSHLPSSEFRKVLLESDYIISRSGYSTIMELASLNRSALLIPTPGQTEQEYLAQHLSGMGWFETVSQKHLKKGLILPRIKHLNAESISDESSRLLEEALTDLLYQQEKDTHNPKSGKKS
ncbi:MAG: UDP-N-acetylglucosamine--N-acetylmuramyl-(pentapeptide) pyrophosphoryl-undecaprenol N-acetylglucosamine transferase [Bacteroidales bacterium]|nr:UDP-N-acetylglucosamine--N-acetylmuramyl-(pentapeptide) pyrophosphoryl-undecaprenol N-acetylglucosamine transferase [Bacteroidales bacterium]